MQKLKLVAMAGFALAALAVASTPAAAAERCVIWDQNDTSANIRATPNGRRINTLRNGRVVYAQHYRNDRQGRPWAYVAGYYKGVWRNWGYVYVDLIRC